MKSYGLALSTSATRFDTLKANEKSILSKLLNLLISLKVPEVNEFPLFVATSNLYLLNS
jgi:hypothetical protein